MKNRLQTLLTFSLAFFLSSFLLAQEFGIASVYQDKFDGKTTAYGRIYNKNELVAAHKKHLPGTYLKITRLDNKKTVTVEVIDRGPFVKGRIVDISSRAARELGMLEEGVANVKVEVIQQGKPGLRNTVPDESPAEPVPPSYDNAQAAKITPQAEETAGAGKTTTPLKTEAEPTPPKTAVPEEKPKETPKGAETAAPVEKSREALVGKGFIFFDLYKLELSKAAKTDFGVQVAYLSNFESLFRQVANLQAKSYENILFSVEKGEKGELGYKVILGPFESEDKAKAYQASLAKKGQKGFVVAVGENYEQNALYKIQLKTPAKLNYGVQVASLTSEEGVLKQVADLQAKWFDNTLVNVEKGEDGVPVYKIILGPFESESKATTYKSSLSSKHRIKGFVVALN